MITIEAYLSRAQLLDFELEIIKAGLISFENDADRKHRFCEAMAQNTSEGMARGVASDSLLGRVLNVEDLKDKWFGNAYASQIAELPNMISNALQTTNLLELVARFSLFEQALKEIHRAILLHSPSLLKADRKIELGRLVSRDRSELLAEEADREVGLMDRESLGKRRDYFRDRLGVVWSSRLERYRRFSDEELFSLADEASERRNSYLHLGTPPTVSPEQHHKMILALSMIPLFCMENAEWGKYPGIGFTPLEAPE